MTTIEERYRKYVDRLILAGEHITTRTQAAIKDAFYIHERRENSGIELPPGVLESRRANDILHRIEQRVQEIEERDERIEKNTSLIPRVATVFRNMFAKSVGDFDEHILSKKK